MPKYAKITGNTRQWLKINKQIQGKKNHFCKDFLRQIIIREKKNCFPIIIKAINKELEGEQLSLWHTKLLTPFAKLERMKEWYKTNLTS